MKRNSINKMKRWNSISKCWIIWKLKTPLFQRVGILILLFSLSEMPIKAQTITKTFTKEEKVPPNISIITEGPQAISYEMHGSMSSRGSEEGYILTSDPYGKNVVLQIGDFHIHTWKKPVVKQEIQISLQSEDNEQKQIEDLINNLKIDFQIDANNRIAIDGNMNIEKFELINGWFRRDRNTVVLEDGSKYNIGQIKIKSSLYIPESSNLEIFTENLSLQIGDLTGNLSIDVLGGTIKAGNVNRLEANLPFCTASFNEVTVAEINTNNSKIKAKSIKELQVGSLELSKRWKYGRSIFSSMVEQSNSTMSRFSIEKVDKLTISETINDFFVLGEVGTLKAPYAKFTDFEIQQLHHALQVGVNNGDLKIRNISNGFSEIEIENKISTIKLGGITDLTHFDLNTNNTFTEEHITDSILKLNKREGKKKSYLKGDPAKAGIIDIRCESCTIYIEE